MKNHSKDIDILVQVFKRRAYTRRDPVELTKRFLIGGLLHWLSNVPLKITVMYLFWRVGWNVLLHGPEIPWETIGFLFAGSLTVRAAFFVSGNRWVMSLDERLVCARWRYFKRDLQYARVWDVLKGCASADELKERVWEHFRDRAEKIADIPLQTPYGAELLVLHEHTYNRHRATVEALLGVPVPQLSRFEVDGDRAPFSITVFPQA